MCRNKTHATIMTIKLLRRFFASCYCISGLVYQRRNNKNTEVAVINIYCNYFELILNNLQETFKQFKTGKQANIGIFVKKREYSNT